MKDVFGRFLDNECSAEVLGVMAGPFEDDGFIYATDRHILIRMPKEKCEWFTGNVAGNLPPATARVFYPVNTDEEFGVDFSPLAAYKTKKESEFKKCKECNGHGNVAWEYKQHQEEYACPECKGEGGRDIYTGKLIWQSMVVVKVKDAYVAVRYMELIQDAAKAVGAPLRLVGYAGYNRALIFKAGTAEMLVMPVHVSEGDQENYAILDMASGVVKVGEYFEG